MLGRPGHLQLAPSKGCIKYTPHCREGGGCCLPLTNWMIENHLAQYLAKYTLSTLSNLTSLHPDATLLVFCKHAKMFW